MGNVKDDWFETAGEDLYTDAFNPKRNNHWGYLSPKLREQYTKQLVENVLRNITDREILAYSPQYLGPDVGPQHREYIRAKAQKELQALDDYTLIRRYVDQDPKDELTKESFKQGQYLGDRDKTN